jgi:hypothetical protein
MSNQNTIVSGTITFVPESEYKKLLDENIILKRELNQCYLNERLFRENIKNNELTIEELRKENEMFKKELTELKATFQKQDNVIKEQKVEINELKETVQKQDNVIKEQKVEINELKETVQKQDNIIKEQKVEINELKETVQKQNIKITKLEEDIKELKSRDTPITIREAMNILETHIMVELVGSKRQANRFYGLYDLSRQPNYLLSFEKFLEDNKITQEHIDLLLELKKEGNKSAHSNRPTYNKDEWKQILLESLDDPSNKQDIIMIDDIITLMEKYNPVGNPWIMTKP